MFLLCCFRYVLRWFIIQISRVSQIGQAHSPPNHSAHPRLNTDCTHLHCICTLTRLLYKHTPHSTPVCGLRTHSYKVHGLSMLLRYLNVLTSFVYLPPVLLSNVCLLPSLSCVSLDCSTEVCHVIHSSSVVATLSCKEKYSDYIPPGAPLRILGPLHSIFTRALLPSGGYGWGYRGISPSVEIAIAFGARIFFPFSQIRLYCFSY